MEEKCIRYIKPANVYRYCCFAGSWPISKAEAASHISTWVLNEDCNIEILENEWVKVFAPTTRKE